MTDGTLKQAKDLVIGDKVEVAKYYNSKDRRDRNNRKIRTYEISEEVDQIILGTLLGDSSLYRKSSKNNTILLMLHEIQDSIEEL